MSFLFVCFTRAKQREESKPFQLLPLSLPLHLTERLQLSQGGLALLLGRIGEVRGAANRGIPAVAALESDSSIGSAAAAVVAGKANARLFSRLHSRRWRIEQKFLYLLR